MPKKNKKPIQSQGQPATAGITDRLKEDPITLTFVPSEVERKVQKYINRRVGDMQDYRKGLGIENRWKEADEEYIPHELDFGTTRKRF